MTLSADLVFRLSIVDGAIQVYEVYVDGEVVTRIDAEGVLTGSGLFRSQLDFKRTFDFPLRDMEVAGVGVRITMPVTVQSSASADVHGSLRLSLAAEVRGPLFFGVAYNRSHLSPTRLVGHMSSSSSSSSVPLQSRATPLLESSAEAMANLQLMGVFALYVLGLGGPQLSLTATLQALGGKGQPAVLSFNAMLGVGASIHIPNPAQTLVGPSGWTCTLGMFIVYQCSWPVGRAPSLDAPQPQPQPLHPGNRRRAQQQNRGRNLRRTHQHNRGHIELRRLSSANEDLFSPHAGCELARMRIPNPSLNYLCSSDAQLRPLGMCSSGCGVYVASQGRYLCCTTSCCALQLPQANQSLVGSVFSGTARRLKHGAECDGVPPLLTVSLQIVHAFLTPRPSMVAAAVVSLSQTSLPRGVSKVWTEGDENGPFSGLLREVWHISLLLDRLGLFGALDIDRVGTEVSYSSWTAGGQLWSPKMWFLASNQRITSAFENFVVRDDLGCVEVELK